MQISMVGKIARPASRSSSFMSVKSLYLNSKKRQTKKTPSVSEGRCIIIITYKLALNAGLNLYPYIRLGPRGGGNSDFLTVCVSGVRVITFGDYHRLTERPLHALLGAVGDHVSRWVPCAPAGGNRCQWTPHYSGDIYYLL